MIRFDKEAVVAMSWRGLNSTEWRGRGCVDVQKQSNKVCGLVVEQRP